MNSIPNPLNTNGFAFLEFTTLNPEKTSNYFLNMGFTKIGNSKDENVEIFKQGKIVFILNHSIDPNIKKFAKLHGDATCSMGFYVKDPQQAYINAIKKGAQAFLNTSNSIWQDIPAIQGVGGSAIYFVDENDSYLKRFEIDESEVYGDFGLYEIDHVTHNLYKGNMDKLANFYTNIFGFYQIRYFDIDGKKTGLLSKAMCSPCGKIKIPLNESKDDKSQIEEFLHEFNGEGIQHIALSSKNIYTSVAQILNCGIKLMDTPDTYYELIDKRLPNHQENKEMLKKFRILIDGMTEPNYKILLQIFTQNLLGPTFFEIIQRKGDDGFGEGNFQALFDSIELDQMKRGVV